jgi:hypothetical protein
LEQLFPHYNTFVTPQVFQMTAEGHNSAKFFDKFLANLTQI